MTHKIDWLRGCATALVTPFTSDGEIDQDALTRLIEYQLAGGVKLLVPCGTTGESATMTDAEDQRVIKRTIELARGRAHVIAGTGSNSTAAAIENSRVAEALVTFAMIALGADGLISVAANEAPELMTRMVHLALDGKWDESRELHYRLLPLMEVNFIESSPGPVKAGLAMMNLIGENYRLPLVPIQEKSRALLRLALLELGLLQPERAARPGTPV